MSSEVECIHIHEKSSLHTGVQYSCVPQTQSTQECCFFSHLCESEAASTNQRERHHVQPLKCSSLQLINIFPFVLWFDCWFGFVL